MSGNDSILIADKTASPGGSAGTGGVGWPDQKPEIKSHTFQDLKLTDPKWTPKLNEAFAKAQGEFIQPEKNKTVEVKKEGRVLYTTNYADLKNVIESFRLCLSKNGLSFTQKTRESAKGWRLVLTMKHVSGEYDETEMPIQLDAAPQQVGGNLTYLKRYQAAAYFGIAADDDDDGNAGTGNEAKVTDKPKKPITPAQPPSPAKPNNQAPATPEQMSELSEVQAARDIPNQVLNDLIVKGFQWAGNPKNVSGEILKKVISLLKDPKATAETITVVTERMVADREKAKKPPASAPKKDEKDPADFVLPIGDNKGKKLGSLDEKTIYKILDYCEKNLEKVPPVANAAQLFEIKINVKTFLKSMGMP